MPTLYLFVLTRFPTLRSFARRKRAAPAPDVVRQDDIARLARVTSPVVPFFLSG